MVITKLFPSLTTLSAFQTPALSCRHNWPDLTNTAVSLDPEAKNVAHNRYNKECNVATPATHISIVSPSTYSKVMFPLLPIISDDLASLDPRVALRYQNTFMKNALIRGLNDIYLAASTINDGEHPNFREFMEYAQMVCEMIKLHLRGDDVFFTTPNSDGQSLTDILGEDCTLPSTIALQISSLDEMIHSWNKCPSSYTPSELVDFLQNIEEPIVTGMRKQVTSSSQNREPFFSPSGQVESIQGEYLIGAYSEAQMRAMIEG